MEGRNSKLISIILLTLTAAFPLTFTILRLSGSMSHHLYWETVLAGLSIIGAGFLISWSCELMQLDLPPGFAIALLALVNVLPEYAVDIYFSWKAAYEPHYVHYATSNMTGANRMLIGIGWSLIVLINFIRQREPEAKRAIATSKENSLEVAAMLAATLYSLIIVIKGNLHLVDALFLFAIFGYYLFLTIKGEKREPSLGGPTELIAALSTTWRRILTWTMFAVAAIAIFLSAEPFSEGLIAIGKSWGIDEYLLVQWVAPIASEAPELIAASYFAWKLMVADAFGALVSSKVNQWTLLVGFIPVVYSISSFWAVGKLRAYMPLDKVQVDEMFLTAAQSLLAGVMLADKRFQWWEALILFVLFAYQLLNPDEHVRVIVAWVYIAIFLLFALRTDWRHFIREVIDLIKLSFRKEGN